MRTLNRVLLLAAAAILALGGLLRAADPAPTTITIPEMECLSCAKKVSAALAMVPGVAKTLPDVEAHTMRVMPKGQSLMSPRALWEAVEKAGKTPTKLEGPGGTFTAKPKS